MCSSRDRPPWYIKGTGQFVEKHSSCNPVCDKAWLCVWKARSGHMHNKLCSLALSRKDSGWWQRWAFFLLLLLHACSSVVWIFFNLNYTPYFYHKFWQTFPKRKKHSNVYVKELFIWTKLLAGIYRHWCEKTDRFYQMMKGWNRSKGVAGGMT